MRLPGLHEQASARPLSHDELVQLQRVATLGMSMGAALAMWVGALEPRVAAVAQLCMLASIEGLIETGEHDRHGLYLVVPDPLPFVDEALLRLLTFWLSRRPR